MPSMIGSEKVLLAVAAVLSVTVMVKVAEVAVGVPEIIPVLPFSDKPVGKVPEVTAQV